MVQFNLIPFSPYTGIKSFRGEIGIHENRIQVTYCLEGDLSQVKWPAIDINAARKDRLWQETCFEIFLSRSSGSEYVEFNFSPSGHWQCYEFSDYRTGQNTSREWRLQSFTQHVDDHKAVIDFNIESQMPRNMTARIGPCAVLLDKNNHYHYYAMEHDNNKPDFHSGNNFQLTPAYATQKC